MHKAQIDKLTILCAIILAIVIPQSVKAQSGSMNAFSPYTMYGLGELQQGGSAEYAAMGGIGIGVREPHSFNYLNPASLSAIPQRTAILNLGGQAKNVYSRTSYASTSFNSVNFHDVGLAIPLARGIGFGVALLPVSAVGYSNIRIDDQPSITNNIGSAVYTYMGEGGVSQLQGSLGIRVTRGLSLGVSIHYYFGSLNRYYNTDIYPYLNNGIYRSVATTSTTRVSRVLFTVGGQYQFRVGKDRGITLGATYQPGMKTNNKESVRQTISSSIATDTVSISETSQSMLIPTRLAVGLHYQSTKLGVGIDYIRQDWAGAFEMNSGDRAKLSVFQELRAGMSFTPNRLDLRNVLNRWTYKAGAKIGTSYLTFDNVQLMDYAVTLGLDIPMRKGNVSKISLGAEIGTRGTTRSGQVQENYVRFVAGFTFFGNDDMWFTKVKFD